MVVRIAKIVSASVTLLIVLAYAQPAVCEGWSLPNPFSSKTTTTTKKSVPKVTKKEPSVLQKTTDGTKKFFSQTGEALGLKKAEKKRPQYAYPKTSTLQPKKEESKSWFGKMFAPEEPKKPTNVNEWMGSTKRVDL
jgi:hypothetical protein